MVSRHFEDAFASGGGGIVRECKCGRVHYSTHDSDVNIYDRGELEGLERKAEKDPDRYIGHDHTVGTMHVGGYEEVVFDCPCDSFAMVESFIRNNAVGIKAYLKKWAEDLREKADSVDPSKE